MGRTRLFPLLFQNGCSQSSQFLPQARRIVGSGDENVYTSELILCSTICVHSATRHNIYMYPHFLFAAISSPTFSVRPRSTVGRVAWVPDSHRGQNNFFFTSCGSLIPFTRANAQWVFHWFSLQSYNFLFTTYHIVWIC